MDGFEELLASVEQAGDASELSIPESWHQGRTAYGGFSAAVALHAARRAAGVSAPLRSGQVAFVGPLHGTVEARARMLRSGKNATWCGVELIREGEVGLTATFVFMGPVESALHLNDTPPPADLIPVEQARPLRFVERSPSFLRNHFEVRFARPRSEERLPEFCWWVRPREHAGLDPTIAALLSADAVHPESCR
jgi:acyl-CoA thioesterase